VLAPGIQEILCAPPIHPILSHATREFAPVGLEDPWQTGPGSAISAIGDAHRQQTPGLPAVGAA